MKFALIILEFISNDWTKQTITHFSEIHQT